MKTAGIYSITSPSGGLYLGSAVDLDGRWRGHKSRLALGKHNNAKLQNAWNKYGPEAMKFEVLLICRPRDLLFYEQAAIDALKPRYNICLIAGNTLGRKWKPESCARQSARMKGRKLPPAHRAKIGSSLRGRPVSDETKKKLSAQCGWKHTEESKAKMRGRERSPSHSRKLSVALRGNKNAARIIATELPTG